MAVTLKFVPRPLSGAAVANLAGTLRSGPGRTKGVLSLDIPTDVQLAGVARDGPGRVRGQLYTETGGSFDKYVSPTGSDTTGDGSVGNPWQTTVYAISQMSTNQSLGMLDGTYSGALGTVKAGMTVQAVNDGQVIVTGALDPGNAGFTVTGIRFESSAEKSTGDGNTYERCTFKGGPNSGNVVNCGVGANTTIRKSLFHGAGGRYLILIYQNNGVTLEDIILRPDGGWGLTSGATEFEPHAALNLYDSTGFSGTRIVMCDAYDQAHGDSELLGGIGVNTHTAAGNVGTFSHCLVVDSAEPGYGRFWSDGLGSHNVTFSDCESYGNNYEWGMTRGSQCDGTTTATRFDTDAPTPTAAWGGTINRTSGSLLTLDEDFLAESRWLTEMKASRTGQLGAVTNLVTYLNSFRP